MDIRQSNIFSVKQRGATLIVALVMLLLITMIALTSMQGTAMQQRMSGNMKDRDIAFQAAEAGLRIAEQWLADRKTPPDTYSYSLKCPDKTLCQVFKLASSEDIDRDLKSRKDTSDKWRPKSLAITDFKGTKLEKVKEQPRLTVELRSSRKAGIGIGGGYGANNQGGGWNWNLYRLTARSTGGSGRAEVILQSHYATEYD